MPEDSISVCCDVSEKWTSIARKYWQKAGVDHKIQLKLAPAINTLNDLVESGYSNWFDYAFIDADKANQEKYFEHLLTLLRPGGLLAIDNVIWFGAVIDRAKLECDEDTIAIHSLNQKLIKDERIDISLVPIGDGLTLLRKR
jgi:caffeoyl-CoA O-methyltransferase